MNEFMDANKAKWNEMADINVGPGSIYNLERFRAGETLQLHGTEVDELGDLTGLSVLHLQCHFGLDSLTMIRRGARQVVGLDFSETAIDHARALAEDVGLADRATFVHGNVYDAERLIDGVYDLVFVSWGTVCWLPDIQEWARIAASFVRPGGRFYFVDQHPIALCFDDVSDGPMTVTYPYFHKPEPLRFDDDKAYGDPNARTSARTTYEWTHGVGEQVTALIDAGLTIEFVHEHETVAWQAFPFLVPAGRGLFKLPTDRPRMPLSFSISARKNA